jgi:hypothetical protein
MADEIRTTAAEAPEWTALRLAGRKVAEAHEALKLALQEYAEARARMYGDMTHDGN